MGKNLNPPRNVYPWRLKREELVRMCGLLVLVTIIGQVAAWRLHLNHLLLLGAGVVVVAAWTLYRRARRPVVPYATASMPRPRSHKLGTAIGAEAVRTAHRRITAEPQTEEIPVIMEPIRPNGDSAANTVSTTDAATPAQKPNVRYLKPIPFKEAFWPIPVGIACAIVGTTGYEWALSSFVNSADKEIPWVRAIGAIFITLFAWYYTMMVRKQHRVEYPSPGQLRVPISTSLHNQGGRHVSLIRLNDKELQRVQRFLVVDNDDPDQSDSRIIIATHKHPVSLYMRGASLVLAWIAILVIYSQLPTKAPRLDGPNIGLVALGLGMAIALYMLIEWLQWRAWFLVVTDKRLMVITRWPSFLFWREQRRIRILIIDLTKCESRDQNNFISKLLPAPYGILDLDSRTPFDTEIQRMHDVAEHHTMAEVINALMNQFTLGARRQASSR